MAKQVWATSKHRYRASAAEKRMYGGATVTVFLVGYEGDDAKNWVEVTGYGPTPGERKTDAIKRAMPLLESKST
jgi:hypothetical protein